MYRKILVPVDQSSFAESAIPAALSLAERSGGELHLVTVVSTLPSMAFSGIDDAGGPGWFDEGRRRGAAYLEEVVGRIRDAGAEVEMHTKVLSGSPVRMLHEWILKTGIDQVVMTTHGRGFVKRLWLGSVADGLVRSAPCPILLWRQGTESPDPVVDLKARPGLSRILVPLDGSEVAGAIVPWVSRLAELYGVPVTLASVVVSSAAIGSSYLPQVAEAETLRTSEHSHLEQYLLSTGQQLSDQGIDVETRVLIGGGAADEILTLASDIGADLVALSSHGRGGVARMVVGSVADKLIRGSESHVLVHREADAV